MTTGSSRPTTLGRAALFVMVFALATALPPFASAAPRVPTIHLGGAHAAAGLDDFAQQSIRLTLLNARYSNPSVTVAANGTATVVWKRASDGWGSNALQGARIDANGYVTDLTDLYATPNAISAPVATTTPSGLTTIAWTESIGSDVVARAMTVGANSRKTAPLTLSAAGLDVERVKLATADSAVSTVAWRASTSDVDIKDAQTVRIGPNAKKGGALAKLTKVIALGRTSSYSYGPAVATTPKGVATLVWNDGGSMLKAVRQDAGNRFGKKIGIAATGMLQYFMETASNPSGQTAVIWSQGGTMNHAWLDRSGRVGPIRQVGGTVGAIEGALAIAPSGASSILWTTFNSPFSAPTIIQIAPNSATGRTFGLAQSDVTGLTPVSSTSPKGVTTFVWSQGISGKRAIVARRLDQRNRLTSEVSFSSTYDGDVNPSVATAPSGVSTVAYERKVGTLASLIEVVRID